MMNHNKYLAICVMSTLSLFTFNACSSNDDEDSPNVESPENNLPESSKAFVGYWTTTSNGDLLFLEDGTCQQANGEEGYWTYNESTQILATTLHYTYVEGKNTFTGNRQWQVTLSNHDAWAGVLIGGSGASQSFFRDDRCYLGHFIQGKTTWTCDSLSLSLSPITSWCPASFNIECDDLIPFETHNNNWSFGKEYRRLDVSGAVVIGSTITASYQIEDSWRYRRSSYNSSWYSSNEIIEEGTLTIKNYNHSRLSLIFSEHEDHEYIISSETDSETTRAPSLIGHYTGVTLGSSQHFQNMSSTSQDTVFISTSKKNSNNYDVELRSTFWGNATFVNVTIKEGNNNYEFADTEGTIAMPQRRTGSEEVTFINYPALLRGCTIHLEKDKAAAYDFIIEANLGERAGIYTLELKSN